MKYEYKTYETTTPLNGHQLNTLGAEGWELSGFTLASYSASTSARFHYIFKRLLG